MLGFIFTTIQSYINIQVSITIYHYYKTTIIYSQRAFKQNTKPIHKGFTLGCHQQCDTIHNKRIRYIRNKLIRISIAHFSNNKMSSNNSAFKREKSCTSITTIFLKGDEYYMFKLTKKLGQFLSGHFKEFLDINYI